jgi:dipeptidyl aminopeptidase/acylaminoacyl peptidase
MPSYLDYIPTLRLQSTFSVGPDGRNVAYVDDSLGQFNAVIKPLSGGESRRQTAFMDKAVQSVAWHPLGKSLVLSADTGGDEKDQIYLAQLDAGDPVALTEQPNARYEVAVGNPVSPDGRLLAFAGNDRDPVDQEVLVRNLATGEVRRVYQGGGQVYAGHWSPGGTCLSAFEFRDQESHHVVHLLSSDGGPSRMLAPRGEPATYWLGPWLRDGSGFVVRSNEGREFTGLAVMSADTGELSWIDTPDWDVEAAAMSESGNVLAWIVNVDGYPRIRARDMTTGADIGAPALPAGAVSGLAVTPDGGSIVLQLSTATTPRNLAVVDLRSHEFRWLTDARPTVADSATFAEPELIRYPARDGRVVPAYLYRPMGSTGKHGVLLSIHGGPDHQERPSYMYDGLYQYLLSHGVAVLVPNFRGSRGYGISNIRLIHRNWGAATSTTSPGQSTTSGARAGSIRNESGCSAAPTEGSLFCHACHAFRS